MFAQMAATAGGVAVGSAVVCNLLRNLNLFGINILQIGHQ